MMNIYARNVNAAYDFIGPIMIKAPVHETRNGPAHVYPTPVITVYERPWERVLLYEPRRANCFFHLFEAFWMLAGRQDAAFLDNYVRDFGQRYAEEDGNLHGAYGYRWIFHFGFNQVRELIEMLKKDPTTRRAVLTMWNPTTDLATHKLDIPCNTQIYFRIQLGDPMLLDMTVLCRSNDAVWGAYGANAVHMSVLQEFVAWQLGIGVGKLYQFSNNLHAYRSTVHMLAVDGCKDPYEFAKVRAVPLFSDTDRDDRIFHAHLADWMEKPSRSPGGRPTSVFNRLLVPMSRLHDAIRDKDGREALSLVDNVVDLDWRLAAWQFVRRRFAANGAPYNPGEKHERHDNTLTP